MSLSWFENTHCPPPLSSTKNNATSENLDKAQFSFLLISHSSPRFDELVSKFRDTKLLALKNDPKAFVQQYDLEIQHPLSVWHTRLAHGVTVLVCVADRDPAVSIDDTLLQKEWVGFGAVRGPIAFEEYYASPDMEQIPPPDPENEARWHFRDLYIFPTYRGYGIATTLGEALVRIVIQNTMAISDGVVKRARMRLIVHPKSTWLVEGYTRMGFTKSGILTLKEGFLANGIVESIPRDTSSTVELKALWETRYGMFMENVVDVTVGA